MKKIKMIGLALIVSCLLYVGCTNSAGGDGGAPVDPNAPKIIKEFSAHGGSVYGAQMTVHGQIRDRSGKSDLTGRYGRITKTLAAKTTEDDIFRIASFAGNQNGNSAQGTVADSAGLYFSFITDSASLKISGKFSRVAGQIYAVNETGNTLNCRFVSGHFDLYRMVNDEWVYVSTVKGQPGTTQDFSGNFTALPSTGTKEKYLLLFPLYNGVQYDKDNNIDIKMEIDNNCYFADAEFMRESSRDPILIYGTSITQGAAPSHVGEAYTHQIMLTLKHEVINMGFSGSAYMSNSMGDFISTIPSSVFIIDPTMNHKVDNVSTFVGKYRAKYSNVPIVLVSQFDNSTTATDELTDGEKMKACWQEKKNAGDQNIYFVSRLNDDGTAFTPTYANDTSKIHPDTPSMKLWAERIMNVMKGFYNK